MPADHQSKLRALQCFEAVARLRSISKAAAELGVTQSAVSHQLRDLTQQLGESLMVKSGRGIALTPAGAELAADLHSAFSVIANSVSRIVGNDRQRVRLAICSSFAPGWLIPRLADFYRSNPGFELQLLMYAKDPELTDHVADAFVTSHPEVAGFHAMRLAREMLVAVAARTPRGARGSSRRSLITTDLAPEHFADDWKAYAKATGEALETLHDGTWLQCSHYILALEMARNGLGAALVPEFLAAPHLDSGSLMRLGPVMLPTGEDYYLCMKQSRRGEAALKLLEKWFRAQSAEIMSAPHAPPAKLISRA
jgi:LysR family glycine cleavage system transcriptional activator